MNSKRFLTRSALPRRSALVAALALGLGMTGFAYGQATNGSIFGSAPAGDTVVVTSNSGITRTATVGSNGNYTVSSLPLGTYTVTLKENGEQVSSRNDVEVKVGGGVSINFGAQNAQELGAVTVNANALPAIDVTSTADSTTITARELKRLPVGRNLNSIALLTPGTMQSPVFTGISFGGSSVTENAFYVNGYNSGNPYSNFTGFQLPYGAIAQQQTMAGAFGAKYGRSDGGVISQVGKSGTNEWHYGAQIVWEPRSLKASPKNQVFPDVPMGNTLANGDTLTIPWVRATPYPVGSIYNYNSDDTGWMTTYTGYIGGPIIQDKLFFFLDAEYTENSSQGVSSILAPAYTTSSGHETKIYGKINWNINDDNIFEFTVLDQKKTSGIGSRYNYDYSTHTSGTKLSDNNVDFDNAKFYIGKYTSYIGDNATLEITYGKGEFRPTTRYAVSTDTPLVGGWAPGRVDFSVPHPSSLPAPPTPPNPQTVSTFTSPDSHLDTHGLRVDFSYQLGDHDLMIGIDNMKYRGEHQGVGMTGSWAELDPKTQASLTHEATGLPTSEAQQALLSGQGEWIYEGNGLVLLEVYNTLAGMQVKQNAWYVQDKWQLTPDLLFNIGVRNEEYANYTGTGQKFVDEKNQWEPRLGISWDVFGDSSLKIYANAGRYYLALPLSAANRAADRSTFLGTFFTYSGITANGTPVIDLASAGNGGSDVVVPIGWGGNSLGPGHVGSPDGEFSATKDVNLVVSKNLKPMYVDQFHLGFDAKTDFLNTTWTYGAKLSYRKTGTIIDDQCATGNVMPAALTAMGLDPADYDNSWTVQGQCRLFNPGRSNVFTVKNNTTGDYVDVTIPDSAFGWPQKPKRKYEAVDLHFAHPFDGKWSARVDYTWAKAKGNTVGQVRPDIGQDDVSKTEDWDYPSLMSGAYGELPNVRKQVLRLRGSYSFTPDWALSLTARIQSGLPLECLGYYGPNATGDPAGYNGGSTGNYHWCMGAESHSGSNSPLAGHTPWMHVYNLALDWTPAFADHKLDIQLAAFNVLNEQVGQRVAQQSSLPQTYANGARIINPLFHLPTYEPARSVRLSISYDY